MKKLLHTPEGVRDIYNVECGKKLALEGRIKKVFHLYGYHDIQTPTFEYFDVFRKEIGTVPSNELYKFFDKDGNTLALRPDITPSIAARRPRCSRMRNCPSGFAIPAAPLSTIPTIRDVCGRPPRWARN